MTKESCVNFMNRYDACPTPPLFFIYLPVTEFHDLSKMVESDPKPDKVYLRPPTKRTVKNVRNDALVLG